MSDEEKIASVLLRRWFNPATERINIACRDGAEFNSTVNANANGERGNPSLYFELTRVLRAAGKPGPKIPEKRS